MPAREWKISIRMQTKVDFKMNESLVKKVAGYLTTLCLNERFFNSSTALEYFLTLGDEFSSIDQLLKHVILLHFLIDFFLAYQK